jgi:Sigma-70 region 2
VGGIDTVHSEMTDAEVAHGFSAGHEHALGEAYQRWSRVIHSTALRSTGNPQDAADITQEVFVSAWRGRGTYRADVGSLPGWLMTITRARMPRVGRGLAAGGCGSAAGGLASRVWEPLLACV